MVAAPCLQLSPIHRSLNDGVLVPRSTLLGTMSTNLSRTRSFEFKTQQRSHYSIRRACSASFDSSYYAGDEEFSRKINELALRFQLSGENAADSPETESTRLEEWNPASIEMRAKGVDLPISLRMIKRKKNQLKESLKVAGETAYCSMKKAFSSMVFMIRELHSHSLQMREQLFYEDLQGILVRVQSEMHASFVWLFQQVFSHTPTLMVYIMILLANFTVHSMSASAAFAAVVPPSATVETEISTTVNNFDTIKSFYLTSSSSGDKTTSVGGNNGGGNKYKPVASGMDGDGWMNNSSVNINRPIVSDGVSPFTTREEESVSGQEEVAAWKSILDEASRMQGQFRDKSLVDDVTKWFVSPVTAKIEAENVEDYGKTELVYQTELAQEPNNVLLLANYAQFLYLVLHDFDRAEEYFKRAIKVEPKDAEAHNKYATFLWQVRNDLWAAEETYLEAISADPTNSFYAANYAHFLWNTGGEDTCFPLDFPDDENL
ncbi:hypothetical protein RND81_01G044600 [Saponaria officinalis]|uniref:Uncharacterized protein n=1 Tax=Saponaria officinalis TaxID=3572 RepID=A0AAW1NG54_SAPOF